MARIDDFKAALIGGGARANQFRVLPQFPAGVTNTDSTGLGLVQLGSFMIKTAQLPGSELTEIMVPYRGRELYVPGDRKFQPWTITVINDNNFAIRNAMESWSNNINTHVGNTSAGGIDATDFSSYVQDWTVEQIGKDGQVSKSITLRGCFPTTIDPIDVSFDTADTISEFTATIRYQFWTSNTTDNVG
tara:strand:- start:572 stop:1138 length:567 start_codon:yes stop_codon:yes gene_type:complete